MIRGFQFTKLLILEYHHLFGMQSKKQLLTDLLDSETSGPVTDLRNKFNRSLDNSMGKDNE